MVDKTREIALKVLYKIDTEQGYSNIVLDEILNKNKQIINEKDIGLISEITYGVTTWKLTLDEIIKKYSKIKIKKISSWILNILRMGIYQIIFLDKIPKSAAVNESVNLSKKYGHKASSNFVNAILRKVEKTDYEELSKIEDNIQRISKFYSMPEWIIKELLKENDIKIVEEICKNSNLKPKLTIRINLLKTNKEELLKIFKDRNINYKETDFEDFIILEKIKNIEKLDLFKEGYFTIQDISAGLTAKLLNPAPQDFILDACAAPGGKTTYMAEIMKNSGQVIAFDIHAHRIKLIEENSKRLGINIIKTKIEDASIYNEKYKEKFDKILLDVPCLGLGVIKRKPDIKWKRNFEDIKEITNLQENILKNCSKYLKCGGELVYSTCSILKSENEEIINKFLKENSNFINITNVQNKENKLKNDEFIKIFPDSEKDGFFMCKLIKK